jgi:flavodoxin I
MILLGPLDNTLDVFGNAMDILYEFVSERGAKLVGVWPADDYDFISSKALVNDEFVGLVLDQENQKLLTDARLEAWLKQIASELGLPL